MEVLIIISTGLPACSSYTCVGLDKCIAGMYPISTFEDLWVFMIFIKSCSPFHKFKEQNLLCVRKYDTSKPIRFFGGEEMTSACLCHSYNSVNLICQTKIDDQIQWGTHNNWDEFEQFLSLSVSQQKARFSGVSNDYPEWSSCGVWCAASYMSAMYARLLVWGGDSHLLAILLRVCFSVFVILNTPQTIRAVSTRFSIFFFMSKISHTQIIHNIKNCSGYPILNATHVNSALLQSNAGTVAPHTESRVHRFRKSSADLVQKLHGIRHRVKRQHPRHMIQVDANARRLGDG